MRTGKRPTSGKVKVYRFRLYDIGSEDFRASSRMATHACIRRIHAELIRSTELEIDKKDLNADGMTEVVFYDREASRRASSRREDLHALPDANSEFAYQELNSTRARRYG